ncbi:MAG: hypothetical protein JXN62_08135 [Bacteroidales bacterium]|nr:hypothetical protein [Bacteroidales bacterium]
MEEKIMSGEESLKIITEMINRTKINIRQGSFHLLFWGWLIFVCSLSEYLLWKFTDFASPWYIWFFVIPGVFVSLIYGFTTGRKQKIHTYADKLYMWTWLGFMAASVVLFIIVYRNIGLFAPLILALAGMPTFISGFIIKFRPLIIGGITFWVLALIAHFGGPSVAPLAVPVAMITGYLAPGYLLKKKVDHESV